MKSRRLKNKTKQTTVITNMYGNPPFLYMVYARCGPISICICLCFIATHYIIGQ